MGLRVFCSYIGFEAGCMYSGARKEGMDGRVLLISHSVLAGWLDGWMDA